MSAFVSYNAFAQNVSVFENIWGPLSVDVEYDNNMNPVSHSFSLIFQDANYNVLDKPFVYVSGSAQDIFDSLRPIEEFALKYDKNGLNKNYNNLSLTRFKMPLLNYVNVDLGDKEFDIALYTINQIKKRLIKYCKKHKLELPN